MAPEDIQQIREAEERLRVAMLLSDVEALDWLISDDLLFTNHMGQVLGKADDLAMHRSGALKFQAVETSELKFFESGGLPATSVRIHLSGFYEGSAFTADLRFTRIWRRTGTGSWQLAVAHSSVVQPN